MDINCHKYKIEQDGIAYILSSEIYKEYVRLTCDEINKDNPQNYIGDFSLNNLRIQSQYFNNVSTIREAQEIINKIIEDQKISIESHGNYINIFLFLTDGNENENLMFTLIPYSSSQVEITYSPTRRLSTNHLYYPPENIRRPTFYINGEKKDTYSPQNQSYNKVDLTLTLSPKRNNNTLQTIEENDQTKNTTYIQQSPHNLKDRNNLINYSLKGNITLEPNNQYNENPKLFENQNEVNKLKAENQSLKVEKNELIDEINQLKNQKNILNSENSQLKQNKGINPNENEYHENIILKQEIEKLTNELKNSKNIRNNEIEQYKKNKEEEIIFYKSKIEKLLSDQNNLQKENNDLKIKIEQLLHQNDVTESQYQLLLNKNISLQNQLDQEIDIELIEGEIIKNNNEMNFLAKKLVQDKNKIILNLIYKASIDSDKALAFHNKCDYARNSLVLVETRNGKRFGGFTSRNWEGNSVKKKDYKAFIFSLDKMQIYDIIPGEQAIGCYKNYGPIFLGYQIIINDEAFTRGGSTCLRGKNYNTNEDYELNDGVKQFQIKEIEVFEVKVE